MTIPVIKHPGPDQRTEERCIVAMMACPHCHGPVHDPRQKRPLPGERPNAHHMFECMSDSCGWTSFQSNAQPKTLGGKPLRTIHETFSGRRM